ncbi:MAG: hypothetical protein N3G19_01260 [Candidatus Pacearchaeota archaeon]|nr:hypothetical protein [Candidatus Pacearchaeota archaeon]
MASLKEALLELKEIINNILSKKIDFDSKIINDTFSFKQREREYYAKEIENSIKKLEAILSESFIVAPLEKRPLAEAALRIKELKKQINDRKFLEAVVAIEQIYDVVPYIKIADSDLPKSEFFLPFVPKDIFAEVKASFDEMIKCYEHNCYRSALILCGRILEIALHRKYFELTKQDLLEKSPDIGLGSLVAKFKEKNMALDPGLSNQIHLINHLRIASVHKRKQPFCPTKTQTKACIFYTIDTLKKLFPYRNQ